MPRMRPRYRVFAVVYAAFIAGVVLSPVDPNRFWNFLYQRFGIVWTLGYEIGLDVLVNLLLFLPVGFAVHAWRRGAAAPRARDTALVVLGAAAVSAALETLQWAIGHRDASMVDVVSDTAGAAVGCVIDRARHRPGPVAAAPAAEDS